MKQRLFKKDYYKLQEEVDIFYKRVQELEGECSSLRTTLNNQGFEIEKKVRALKNAEIDLAMQQMKRTEAQSRIEELTAALRQAEEGKEREVEEKTQAVKSLEQKLRIEEACTASLRSEVSWLRDSIETLNQEKEEHQERIARETQKAVELARAEKETKCRLNQERKVREGLSREIDQLCSQLSKKDEKVDSLQQELTYMKVQVKHLEEMLQPKIVRLALRLSGHSDG